VIAAAAAVSPVNWNSCSGL